MSVYFVLDGTGYPKGSVISVICNENYYGYLEKIAICEWDTQAKKPLWTKLNSIVCYSK